MQTLAGVLLPSATVFLLLLCNDKDVLGPWVNSRKLNVFTSAVVWVLVLLSIILTASVLFPGISSTQIIGVLASGVVLGAVVGLIALVRDRRIRAAELTVPVEWLERATWRMPALERLSRHCSRLKRKAGLFILRGYLFIAFLLVIVKVVEVAVNRSRSAIWPRLSEAPGGMQPALHSPGAARPGPTVGGYGLNF